MTISLPGVLLGEQTPRVSSWPAYATSAGPEAVELAATAGLVLDPWQADVLTHALGEQASGDWAASEVGLVVPRQNGKGSVLEARVLAGLILFGEALILWSAHEFKTAMEAFRRVQALFTNIDDLRKRVKRVTTANGDESIELISGARLRFVARSKGSGRGFSGDLIILDEAYALTPDHMAALLPTLSARPNTQIWYTSSPPLDSESGHVLFGVRRRGIAKASGLAYCDWGRADVDLSDVGEVDPDGRLRVDLDDRQQWCASNPALGIRITESAIERERQAMSPVDFARERLGVWPPEPAAEGGPVDMNRWHQLADESSTPSDVVALAVDVTPKRTWAAIAVASLLPDGRTHLEIVEHERGTAWVVDRVVELRDRWRPVAVAVDAKGPAGSLLGALEAAGLTVPEDADRPGYGDLIVPNVADVGAAYGQLVDAVVEGTAVHIDQVELNVAVAGAKTRSLGDGGEAWARRTAAADISPLVAVTLARWALLVRAPLVSGVDYDVTASVY